MKLTDLPNISVVTAEKLTACGITTPEQLFKIGSKGALLRIREQVDPGACLSMLYGLEGAIEGVRSHNLSEATKQDLRAFHRSLKK